MNTTLKTKYSRAMSIMNFIDIYTYPSESAILVTIQSCVLNYSHFNWIFANSHNWTQFVFEFVVIYSFISAKNPKHTIITP
jgi:hypothetical protein